MKTVSKNKVDALIPSAIKILGDSGFRKEDGSISKTYHGYFSAFGADMINSTPLAATLFAEEGNKKDGSGEGGTKEDRSLIPAAIFQLMNHHGYQGNKLSGYIINRSTNGKLDRGVLNDIMAASVAFRMALKSFKKS